jgi:hypothetical protein
MAGSDGGSRRPPIVPLLVLLSVIGGLVFLVLVRSSPQQQIRRLIDRQMKLASAGRTGQLHATLSAAAKRRCPRADFVGELQQMAISEPNFWSFVDIKNIHVQVVGNRAMVTYDITYNGRVVEMATPRNPDVYVRATQTVLGPKPNLQQALATLDKAHSYQPGIGQTLGDKEYKAQKARLLKFGTKKPVVYKKGEWYDDLDAHIRCTT